MSIFDGLPNPAAPGQAFLTGLQQGKAERADREVRGALAAYAMNPDDPQAFQTLAQYKPELAISIRQDQDKHAKELQLQNLQARAAQGDKAAQAQLWGIAPDTADKISDNQRAEMGQRVSAIGEAALRISQLPPAERPGAWDSAVESLSRDYPELAQYKGQYSDSALNSAIDNAKLVSEHFNLERPQYMAPQPGAPLVNVRDPQALQAYNSQVLGGVAPPPDQSSAPVKVSTLQEAHSLAPGTHFIDPNGVQRVVPGGASASRVGAGFLDGL